MKAGDLVMIKQSIREYVDERGESLGVILEVCHPSTMPSLGIIMWSDGEIERLYSDEVDIVRKIDENR